MKRLVLLLLLLILSIGSTVAGQAVSSLESTFNQAAQAMQAGNYDTAERGFQSVLASDPQNVPALGNLGVLYSRTHRFAKAIDTDERALHIEPGNHSLLLNLGLAYMKEEQYSRALPYFKKLDALDGGDTKTPILLATCMVLGDAPKEGISLIHSRKLDDGDPSGLYLEAVGYARLNNMAAAPSIFQSLLADRSTRPRANFLLGQALHEGHRLPEAASSFAETLHDDPVYPGAHRELGKVYISMQHFPEAERELRLAIAQDPQDGSALYFLGALLVQSARESEGTPYLRRAKVLMPDSWAIPFYLGKAEVEDGHAASAVSLLQNAAAMNAEEPQVFYLLARVLRASGRGEEAKQAMARVQTLHSSALEAEKQAMSRNVAGAH